MDNNQEKRLSDPGSQDSLRARRSVRRKRRAKKLLRSLCVFLLVTALFAVVATIVVPVLFGGKKEQEDSAKQSDAQTAAAYTGNIYRMVYGSGSVQPVSQPGVYASTDGAVAKTYVSMGDEVKAGDILMELKNETLESEIAQLEYDLIIAQNAVEEVETYSATVERQIYWESGRPRMDVETGEPLTGTYSNELMIRAPSAGRVMAIYIEPGDDALAVYREMGAVMILSTDGRMKVELEDVSGGLLSLGQTVQVTGKNVDATGEVISLSRRGTQAVIEVDSDEFAMDTPVEVTMVEGEAVGSGVLAVNKPLAVSAYGGTINSVEVKVGQIVEREDRLARFGIGEKPLYIDNASVLRDYAVAKAALEAAREKANALRVVAPCDGKVVSIDVELDADVVSGDKLITLVEDAGMEIILTVDELDIPLIEKGQQVTMTVDAIEGMTIMGEVKKIAPLGNTEASVTTFDVYIRVENVDERVLGGMNVSGEIQVDAAADALLIPTDAIGKDEEGYYVTLEDGSRAHVTTGIMSVEATQILSGLSEGDTVVY